MKGFIIHLERGIPLAPIQIIGKTPHPLLPALLRKFFNYLGKSAAIDSVAAPVPAIGQEGKLILLFQDSFGMSAGVPDFYLPEHTVAIANAQNVEVLQNLEGTFIQTIPCGLSSRDTFTLASSTEESLVVALQRSIISFQGETVEPMEFPVHNPELLKLSRYGLMAFCAVGCLEGEINHLLNFLRDIKS